MIKLNSLNLIMPSSLILHLYTINLLKVFIGTYLNIKHHTKMNFIGTINKKTFNYFAYLKNLVFELTSSIDILHLLHMIFNILTF